MLTIVLYVSIAVLLVVIAVMAVKGKKSKVISAVDGSSLYEILEVEAMEKAEEMPAEERESLMRKYESGSYDCRVVDGIVAKLTDLTIAYVDVRNIRYACAKDAIEKGQEMMTKADALRLLTLEKEMYILRKQKFSAQHHYKTANSPLLGITYIYNECTIGIDVGEGKWANKAARIAVKIGKKENGEMQMTDIYLASEDISSASNYDHFDLRKTINVKRFEKLICKNEEEYGEEVQAIQEILGRIEKFNYLIKEGILKVQGNKHIFSAPSDEQLKKIEELNKQQDEEGEDEISSNVINIFEFMHSSQE